MDIAEILNSLTDEDMEKLKATAQQFMGGAGQQMSEKQGSALNGISPDMLSAVAKITGEMNKSDPRCDFLASLKPLLSPERGKKTDDAVMMLKFIRILDAMKGKPL